MTTPTPGPGEVTGLASAQTYATDMTHAYSSAASEAESFAAGLGRSGVDGPAVAAVSRARELTMQAGIAWAQASGALDRQTVVKEAYAAIPEAGGKDFVTEGAAGTPTTGVPPIAGASDADQPSAEPREGQDGTLGEEDVRDRAYEAAEAFMDATTRVHPQRAPDGQDLQIRIRDDDSPDNPWVSLPVRSTVVCDHVATVCTECLGSWEDEHEMRVADVPVSVDLDVHKAGADEFYTFEGEPEFDKPPYWVARHGRTVTSQIAGDPVETKVLRRDDFARGEFADGCCDPTPGAPGAVQVGDVIEVVGERERGPITVTTSTTDPDGGFTVAGTGEDGEPFSRRVDGWEYEIIRRPGQSAAVDGGASSTPVPADSDQAGRAQFRVGDTVRMRDDDEPADEPWTVRVLEVAKPGECECDDCLITPQTFRFRVPESSEDEWMHMYEFELLRR